MPEYRIVDNETSGDTIEVRLDNNGGYPRLQVKLASENKWHSIAGFTPDGKLYLYDAIPNNLGLAVDTDGLIEITSP